MIIVMIKENIKFVNFFKSSQMCYPSRLTQLTHRRLKKCSFRVAVALLFAL